MHKAQGTRNKAQGTRHKDKKKEQGTRHKSLRELKNLLFRPPLVIFSDESLPELKIVEFYFELTEKRTQDSSANVSFTTSPPLIVGI